MDMRSFPLASGVLLLACGARAEVPPPSATPAEIIVSGHTSTAVDIKIVKVGQEIPKTYAGTRIANTPGFEFYVSEHYALKSNTGDGFSRHILEISELAYPHWVAMTGLEPPDPEKRMYIVYGNNADAMIRAMKSDVGMGTAGGYGGGITIWNNRSAYNYPSGTLKYHKRDLVIHENLHMLQCVCLGNSMGTEGMTYAGCQHVYDERKKQLTVKCFDHPTINNFTDTGLTALQKEFVPMQKAVETLWQAGGGHGAMYTQFFWTDPDRYLKWCIWRDEFYAGRAHRDGNARVMEDIFGPLDRLNREWKAWLDARHHSFHFVDWGWEQSGNTLWSYGWPWNPANHSQTDLRYRPGEKVEHDPFRMDYPPEPMPPIVGPVKRGVREPSVGCVVDFSRNPARGRAGMGLGLVSGGITPFAKERLFTDRRGRKQGVTVKAFRLGKVSGEGRRSADVSNGRLLGRSVEATIALGLEGSVTGGLKENFVVEWDGWLRVDETDEYTLSTASDDGSWMWIDGREVIDNGGQHGMVTKTASIRLTGGMHEIRLRFFQGGGPFGVNAGITRDPPPGYLMVLVEAGRELLIDGARIGVPTRRFPFPEAFRKAMGKTGHRVGLTMKIRRAALQVTARADAGVSPFQEDALYVDRAATRKGINVAAYRLGKVGNEGRRSQDVANGELVGRDVDARIALGLDGSPTRGLKENFTVEWNGWLRVEKAGTHGFATCSDDGSWLWIDDRQVVDNGGYHGMTLRTGEATLGEGMHRIRVRYFQGTGESGVEAGTAGGAMEEMTGTMPLGPAERERLMNRYMTILAKDGYHGVTPFIDDARRPWPDLTKPAAPNLWRFDGLDRLLRLYKAARRLKGKAPGSLLELKAEMLAAVDKGPATQARAVEACDARVAGIAGDIRESASKGDLADLAIAEMIGASISLDVADGGGPGELRMTVGVAGPVVGSASGTVRFSFDPARAAAKVPAPQRVRVGPGEQATCKRVVRIVDRSSPINLRARVDLSWRGQRFSLAETRTFLTSVPRWWVIGPFDNPGGHSADVKNPPEDGIDLARRYPGKDGRTVGWRKAEREPGSKVTAEHFVDLVKFCGSKSNVAAYALTYIESPKETDAVLQVGSDDGVVVWLNGARVHANLVGRSYGSRQDRVPMHLKAGRNRLLMKITQGTGGWSFCGHVVDTNGDALPGLSYSLGVTGIPRTH